MSETTELYCAPNVDDSNGTTCYSKDDLVFLVDAYNKNKEKKYQISAGNKSKKLLWESLNEKFKKDCNNERCWLEKNFVPAPYARKHLRETFVPEMPQEWKDNPFEWLSTTDIKNVMKQYEKKYPSFL